VKRPSLRSPRKGIVPGKLWKSPGQWDVVLNCHHINNVDPGV